jgi:hypothetical protein
MHPHHHHHGGGNWRGGGWNYWPSVEYVPYPVDFGSDQEEIPWGWVAIGGLAGLVLAAIMGRR